MRIVRDERRIKILSSIGQYASLGGLLVLLIGLVISFVRPEATWPLIGSMTVGFTLSVIGGFFVDRYAGSLAHHRSLEEVLKGLDYRHTLLQYVVPVDHVLLEPGGCTVCVVKNQGGRVVYEDGEDGEWEHHQRGKVFRRLVGQGGVGQPDQEAREQVERLQQYLRENLEGQGDTERIPVRGVIVFVNEDVELEAEESPVPAFYRKKVKDWLRGPGSLRPLPADLHDRLTQALGADRDAEETEENDTAD